MSRQIFLAIFFIFITSSYVFSCMPGEVYIDLWKAESEVEISGKLPIVLRSKNDVKMAGKSDHFWLKKVPAKSVIFEPIDGPQNGSKNDIKFAYQIVPKVDLPATEIVDILVGGKPLKLILVIKKVGQYDDSFFTVGGDCGGEAEVNFR